MKNEQISIIFKGKIVLHGLIMTTIFSTMRYRVMGLCPSSPLSVIPEVTTLTRYFTMLYGNFWDPPLQNMITTLCCGHHFRALSPFYSPKIAKINKYWIGHYLFSCHFVTVFFEQPPHPGGKLATLKHLTSPGWLQVFVWWRCMYSTSLCR